MTSAVIDIEKEILSEIRKSRERVAHFTQWKNEPSCKRKLGHWRRRLKKALALADEHKLTVPPDPYAPPPPPPTEEELREAAIEEAKRRISFEWQVCVGKEYWAPWGNSGWSAVVLTELNRVWCRASRVDPRTQETVTHSGKVRRDRLIRRDPSLQGKDKPVAPPDEIMPSPESAGHEDEPEAALPETPKPEAKKRTPEEQAKLDAHIAELIAMLDDDSTVDDW